jgi:release factor glutamine methyltransferase
VEEQWTILKILRWTTSYFAGKGIGQPRADAEVLLAHILGMERIQLYLNYERPLSSEELARFRQLVRRRAAFEPTQYIVGKQEFWSLEFETGPAVLIPRPETEILVEKALGLAGDRPALVLDIGTGSGAIAVALAHERPGIRVVAIDKSFPALVVAKRNALRHEVADRVRFAAMDLTDALLPGRRFDIIVSNPPYVAETEFLDLAPEIANYEPHSALRGGGARGLGIVRRILERFRDYLKPGGSLLVEIGHQHADILERERELAGAPAEEFEFIRDYSGIRRVLHVRITGV